MDYFELVVLKFQKQFSGKIVEDYPGKGTPEKSAILEKIPEGNKPVNSPPVGGKSAPVKTILENYNLFYGGD